MNLIIQSPNGEAPPPAPDIPVPITVFVPADHKISKLQIVGQLTSGVGIITAPHPLRWSEGMEITELFKTAVELIKERRIVLELREEDGTVLYKPLPKGLTFALLRKGLPDPGDLIVQADG